MQEFELVSCADHNKSGISEENSSNSLDMNLTSKRKLGRLYLVPATVEIEHVVQA